MESLIPVINDLQDVCNRVKIPLPIDLPQIVVVGDQSSGKSSLIESIVRREFLPRGPGIVTRRPLVIRLFKVTDDDDQHKVDRVKFTHSDREFTNFDEVCQEIEKETEKLCGDNKGIREEPLTLGVYSRDVVNLTLVDLPGLVKIPVGNQPVDIEIRIRDLITSYIKNPNSIILAVIPANIEFATSEALKLAREVDPEGKRTLAVLTKLDIMSPGTDALEVLLGKVVSIRLGIIGVVNRTQEDILNKKPIEKAIEDEANFLKRRYPTIAEKHGQPYLSKRLSSLLMRHIRNCLPDLEHRIATLTSQYQAQLNSYGDNVTNKPKTIIDIITRFSLSYCDTIKGGERQIKTTELCGGARILYIFHDSFGRGLMSINPLESLDNKAILTAARNEAGIKSAICVPDVFELLVTEQIKRLEDPSLRCVELVHQEMGRFVGYCVHAELLRFPNLHKKIEEILTKLLNERLPKTRDAVKNLIGYCTAFIDAEHPRLRESYHVNYDSVMPSGDGRNSRDGKSNGQVRPTNGCTFNQLDDTNLRHERELKECDAIARKINAYFNIVREEVKVFVPRTIMYYMVNYIKSELQPALIQEIYQESLFDELLSESPDIAAKRVETSNMLNALREAGKIINTIHYQK